MELCGRKDASKFTVSLGQLTKKYKQFDFIYINARFLNSHFWLVLK